MLLKILNKELSSKELNIVINFNYLMEEIVKNDDLDKWNITYILNSLKERKILKK